MYLVSGDLAFFWSLISSETTPLIRSKCDVSVLIYFVRSQVSRSCIATETLNFILITRDNLDANSDGMDAAADEGIEMRAEEVVEALAQATAAAAAAATGFRQCLSWENSMCSARVIGPAAIIRSGGIGDGWRMEGGTGMNPPALLADAEALAMWVLGV